MMSGKFSAKKIAVVAVLTALSLITFLIENLFPPLFTPGAKLGLANVFSFIALILYTPLEAFIIVGVRTLLGALFAGNVSAVMYSFTGGMVSMAASSLLLYCLPALSVTCVSVVAACLHNLTQNAVFVLVTGTPLAFSYAPYLVILGVISGAFIGVAVSMLIKKLPDSALYNLLGVKPKGQDKKITENVNKEENIESN